jgi:hypothetical protein
MGMKRIARFLLVGSALAALLAALWAGLIRIGWAFPPLELSLPMLHGPLMINGFLGLVIGLERAVALSSVGTQQRTDWPYLAPICVGVGTVMLFVAGQVGVLLITVGSAILVGVFALIIRRHTALFTLTMGMGALSWLMGNLLWLAGQPIYMLIVWWIGFPLFTIFGERLELSRILRLSKRSQWLFVGACTIFLAGAVVTFVNLDVGMRIAGIGALTCALWLLRYDVTRHTLRKAGTPRYIAFCLAAGYGWLGVSGILNTWFGVTYAGPLYDAALHTLFVGFVFSMIFGHALIILPSVLDVPITFNPKLYGALVLLHGSLLLRVVGSLAGMPSLRQWGGMLNTISLLLFLGIMMYTIVTGRSKIAAVRAERLPHAAR